MPKLEFWYEFASTYSYLSAMRIEAACEGAGVDVVWRPFLLGPIFHAQSWSSSPFNIYPAKGKYMWRDMDRLAEAYGLPPITRPDPFPQNGLLAARIATLGADEPWGPDFTRAVYKGQFANGATICDEAWLTGVLLGLGLDGAGLVGQAKTDAANKALLRERTETAQAMGIFGAPSFISEDKELFWGDDRLNDAINWAASRSKKLD